MFKSLVTVLSFAFLFVSQVVLAGDDRVRLRCDAEGVNDTSMDARYEEQRGRKKFDASFEVPQGVGFVAGDVLEVKVGGVKVGEITLAEQPNGDLGGDLEFDTNDDGNPFPAKFPDVGDGTSVMVGDLGCALD